MQVEFVGHAGFRIEENGCSLWIDPWLSSSDFENPLIQGILPGTRTIDFQIPEPKFRAESARADLILLSHFHPHHSPQRDIQFILERSSKPTIAYPKLSDEKQKSLE